MVLDFYNLTEQPFGVTPDPGYLFMSPAHREALASLLYGVQSSRGFLSLIARPGMGKTSILYQLLNQLDGSTRTVFLFQTLCGPEDLLRCLLRDLGVKDSSGSIASMHEQLNSLLLLEARQGRGVVVVIDEAQNLQDSALELLRMLSNFETTSKKLMQIILSGQPQLREKLASPNLEQLRQRISICARLNPLNVEETKSYIDHRLQVAGYRQRTPLFSSEAIRLIAKHSEGIPRNINNICFNALSIGFVVKQKTIQKEVIDEVLRDLDLDAKGAEQQETAQFELEPARKHQGAINPAFARRSFFTMRPLYAWPSLFALCVVLGLLAWSSRGRETTARFEALPVARANSPAAQVPATSAAVPNHDQSLAGHNSKSSAQTSRSGSVHEMSRSAVSSSPADPAADMAALWSSVKLGNTAAEVKLARIYLDGTVVSQNCEQARLLLSAASRRGSKSANDLLNTISDHCH